MGGANGRSFEEESPRLEEGFWEHGFKQRRHRSRVYGGAIQIAWTWRWEDEHIFAYVESWFSGAQVVASGMAKANPPATRYRTSP